MSRNLNVGTAENAIVAGGDVHFHQHVHNQSRSENFDQLGQCSSTFFVQSPTYRNLAGKSPQFLQILRCLKIVFCFENNSVLMKCKGNLDSTKQNECKCICRINVVSNNSNLAMVLLCILFQSRLQVGQFNRVAFPHLVGVKAIAVFITRVHYLAETLLRKIRRGKRQ